MPSSSSTTRGAPSAEGRGHAALEEVGRLDEVVVDRDDGDADRPRLGVGQQGGPPWCRPCLDGSHEKVTLSSATSSGPGGGYDHTRRGRHHPRRPVGRRRRGRRRGGHLPGDEPGPSGRGRPGRAVHLSRPSSTWPWPPPGGRSGPGPHWPWRSGRRRSFAAAEAGVAAVETRDLARLFTREHGKTHLEAIFDTATVAGMASAFAPLVAEALAPRDLGGGGTRSSGCRTAWSPRSCPSTGPSRSWPTRSCQRCWPGTPWSSRRRRRARERCCWSPPPWPPCCRRASSTS